VGKVRAVWTRRPSEVQRVRPISLLWQRALFEWRDLFVVSTSAELCGGEAGATIECVCEALTSPLMLGSAGFEFALPAGTLLRAPLCRPSTPNVLAGRTSQCWQPTAVDARDYGRPSCRNSWPDYRRSGPRRSEPRRWRRNPPVALRKCSQIARARHGPYGRQSMKSRLVRHAASVQSSFRRS